MKMTPIKKIVIALAAVTVAISLITANNMASVMLLVASKETGKTQTVQQSNNNATGGQVSTGSDNSVATPDNSGSGSTDNSGSGTSDNNTSTATPDASDNQANANANASTNNSKPSNSTSTDKPASNNNGSSNAATDKTSSSKPSTKAEIISYFNTASNKVKTSSKSITRDKEENYEAQPINLGSLGLLQSTVSGLINDNMGVDEEKSGVTATTAADKNNIYPVENETWSSKLTEADVKSATCTESNGVYTITLTINEDPLAAEYAHGTGHHGKAFNIVMPQTIKDNAGAAASLLSSLKVGYQNGKIEVKVDAKTGNITSATYDYTWLLNVDMAGGITAYFGIKTDYTIKW